MVNGHTKRLGRETAYRFANKEAELYLMAEAVQFGKGKAEMHAKVISFCKKEIRAISKKSDGRLD